MRSLLFKELYLHRITIIYYGLGILLAKLFGDGYVAHTLIAVTITCLFIFGIHSSDDKNNSNILIHSLPVKRRHVVLAKYVTALLFALFAITLTTGLHVIISPTASLLFSETNVAALAVIFFALGLFIAVYFPLYYLLGPRFIQIGFVILIILLLTLAPMFVNLGIKNGFWGIQHQLEALTMSQLFASSIGLTLVFLVASYFVAIRLYEKKDF